MTHYQTLGLPPSATLEELRKAWKRESITTHPDRSDGGNLERYTAVQEAWNVLEYPEKRITYNALMYLRQGRCLPCKGAGVVEKTVTFILTRKEICGRCKGSGVVS